MEFRRRDKICKYCKDETSRRNKSERLQERWKIGDYAFIRQYAKPRKFWKNVNKTDRCWFWLRKKDRYGYGVATVRTVFFGAHRVALALSGRVISDGVPLDHLCENRGCVRPEHLEVVDWKENVRRGERTKLDVRKVGQIKSLLARGEDGATSIAKRYGVHVSTIYNVRYGHGWKDVEPA